MPISPETRLRIAVNLAAGTLSETGRPPQDELRMAVSAAYYAMFHTLSRGCADLLIGVARRNTSAWNRVCRALDHGRAKRRCGNRNAMQRHSLSILRFAEWFVEMQRHRHSADYDHDAVFVRDEVVRLVDETEKAMLEFENCSRDDKREFVAYVIFGERNA